MNRPGYTGKMKIGDMYKYIRLFTIVFLYTMALLGCRRQSNQGPLPPASFYDQKIDSATGYIDQGRYFEATELMVRITPGSDSLRELSYQQLLKIYILNGRLYKFIDQSDVAMSYLIKARRLATNFGIKKDMAEVTIQLAELQRVIREYAKANQILRETRTLVEDFPENDSLLALFYNRQASVAVTPDSAVYFSLKALYYARKANSRNLVATSLNELGVLYGDKGFDTIMPYYRQAVALWRKTGNRHEELNTLINIAGLYYSNQQYTLSLMTLDTIRRLLGTQYLRYIEHMRTYLLSVNYQNLGKYDSAFFYLHRHQENYFRDTKGDQNIKARQFEFAEEMANRKYQAEQKEQELIQTKRMNLYIILMVVLLFIFGLFLVFSNLKLRKMNARIHRQKNEINTLYEELQQHLKGKEALFLELHHRVISNLVLIRDVFLFHRTYTTNPGIHNILDSSIARLSSIEKTHQLVFTGSDNEDINGWQYLQSLGHHVLSLQQDTKNAELQLICPDELTFKPKFTQFFGMIFSELLMNSMKHARVGPNELRCSVMFKTDENHLHVIYHDNGETAAEKGESEPGAGENLGLYLIRTLTRQLSGDIRIETNRGFCAAFTFKKVGSIN